MIKLKSLLSESTIACGECLSYAWKTYIINQDNKRANKKMKIVFGTVQNEWISKGKRYKHAWVEDGNLVKDWQTMDPKGPRSGKYAMKGWPIKEFYKFWNAKPTKKYTPKEATDKYIETKSINGWDWK